jgi:hypothetical protein
MTSTTASVVCRMASRTCSATAIGIPYRLMAIATVLPVAAAAASVYVSVHPHDDEQVQAHATVHLHSGD